MEILYSRFIQLPLTVKAFVHMSTGLTRMVNFFASVIHKLSNNLATGEVNSENTAEKTGSGQVLIILADDDKDDREFFEEVVTEINSAIHVKGVKDGLELMEVLNEKDNLLPDILFLDLNMPGKNGKECLTEIKNNSRLKDMPIVIYSTSALGKDIRDTHALGANLYISKPNNFNTAISMIKKVFSLDMENHKPNPDMDNYIISADPQ
jgi:CheY-like chemotaxis protein